MNTYNQYEEVAGEYDLRDPDDIRTFYDNNPMMLLTELAAITGKTVEELKRILMS